MSKQWFVTMEPLAEKALQAVERGELTILPERFEKVFMINYLVIQRHMTPLTFFCFFSLLFCAVNGFIVSAASSK